MMTPENLDQDVLWPRWRHRGLVLVRNTAGRFVAGVALWIGVLLLASGICLLTPFLGPADAAGAWEAAWTPSGFFYACRLIGAFVALTTVTLWWATDRQDRRAS